MDEGLPSTPLDVSPALYKTSGGLLTMIPHFVRALQSHLICFYNPQEYERKTIGHSPDYLIEALDLPLARGLNYVPSGRLAEVEELARHTPLLSTHSFYRYHLLWAHKMFRQHGTPYWHVPHGVLDPYGKQKNWPLKKLYLKAGGEAFLKEAACHIFATEHEQQKAESVFGELPGEIVHWPVEVPEIEGPEERALETRHQLGIPEEARVLLYFGRICGMKRPLETIQAVAAARHPDLHLLMMGPCEELSAQDCRDQARLSGLKNFHFLGPVYGPERFDYVLAADAYISLSWRESFNLTAAECLALGRPNILSLGNNLGPVVAKGGAGWYLSGDQSTDFQNAVQAFVETDSSTLQDMGSAGVQLVNEKFRFEVFAQRLQDLLRQYGRPLS